ncbi:MAG: exosortase/archaeosortase family protein [Planctomycetota bacterium]
MAFLVFAIKISPAIWSVISSKMQTIAAQGAVIVLDTTSIFTGVHATLSGSTINLDYGQMNPPTPMNVAEACAGMRMLMAFLALGVALAFLFPRSWWQRVIMIALAAPIAIFVNVLRVAVLGWVHLIDKDLAHGESHIFIGMLMLIPAAGLLMLVGWCLDKMIISEGKPKPPAPLPFEQDPQQLHIDTPRLIRGAVIGAVMMLMVGVSYVLMINNRSQGTVLDWLPLGASNALLGLTGLLVIGGLGYAWWSVRRGDGPNQIALSQGIIGGLLVAAILGQTSIINATGVALSKEALPLRHGIALSFPDQAGDWELLHLDPKLPTDVEDTLGTEEYFTRYYVNNAAGVTATSIKVKTQDDKPGKRLVSWEGLEKGKAGELAKVHVAYYTGMLDTVPHVPDKCWVVAGSQMVSREVRTLKLDREDYREDPDHEGIILADSTHFRKTVRLPGDTVDAVIFSARSDGGQAMTALYFFLANGTAVASNHEVRFSFNMKDRFSYYCKVEVMFPGLIDPDTVAEQAEDLLSDLMPEVMACLPDWTEVQDGTYPETSP